MTYSIRLLGAVEITRDGLPADASAYRPRKIAFLSYLLLEGRPMRRAEVAGLLWPAVDEKRARGSLNQLLVELRREYGADAFGQRDDDELVVRSGVFMCDAVTLEQYADAGQYTQALALHDGALLAGFAPGGLDEYNDWLDRKRQRIDNTVADCSWHVAIAATDLRESDGALRKCAELRPWDEAVLRRRMQNAAAAGNRAEAAALFETHRVRLANELGIAPAAETRKLLFTLCEESEVVAEEATTSEPVMLPTSAQTLPAQTTPAHTAVRARTGWSRAFHPAFAVAASLLVMATALTTRIGISRSAADDERTVNVALMNFGDETQPVIRALPGLVATYLIRDSAVDVAYGGPAEATGKPSYEVTANLQSDAEVLTGTVQIMSSGALVSTRVFRTSTRVGIDTVAAEIARYVSHVVSPSGIETTPAAALSTAKEHLLFARADFARGAIDNAAAELAIAGQRLDSIGVRERNAEWEAVRNAVARERGYQGLGD